MTIAGVASNHEKAQTRAFPCSSSNSPVNIAFRVPKAAITELFTLSNLAKRASEAENNRRPALPSTTLANSTSGRSPATDTKGEREMDNLPKQPRLTSFAPQFLVDDLARSMTFYEKLGFTFGEPWEGFYAIGQRDGLELHLKEAPKHDTERRHRRDHEHLDAAAGVDGIEAFYERCVANGVTILRPLTTTAWGTQDFYIEDPDGYVTAFGGRPSAPRASQ
jgi:catechol 2,3-dioxygenase-like lactoylglutathione lyase family enzyme